MNFLVLVVCICGFFTNIEAAFKLPKGFLKCKQNDPEFEKCVTKGANLAIPELVKGQPKFGLPIIDPLRITSLRIDQGHGPVNVRLNFTNLDIIGLTGSSVDHLKVDLQKAQMSFKVKVRTLLSLVGQYSVEGKVLVLPIVGHGPCNLTLDKFDANIVGHFNPTEKGGEMYWLLKNLDFDFSVSKLYMNLANLFNGDKALGNQMNIFLNENWKEILEELRPAFNSALTFTFTSMAQRFFEKVPLNQMFPKRNTFTVIDPHGKIMDNYNEEYGSIDTHAPSLQRKTSPKKYLSVAVTSTLIGLILITIFILLVKHHPQLRFWDSDNTQQLQNDRTKLPKSFRNDSTVEYPLNIRFKHVSLDEIQATNEVEDEQVEKKPELPRVTKSDGNMPMEYLIEPVMYNIFLHLNLNSPEEYVFKGNVSITLHAQEETNYIVIGANDLRITSVTLRSTETTDDKSYEVAIDSYSKDDGLLVLQTYPAIKPMIMYALDIEYHGDLQSMPYGLFKISNSNEAEKKNSVLIASNTETPFGRTVFPCFDINTQPSSFELHICRERSARTSATTNLIRTDEGLGLHNCIWDHFEPSPSLAVRYFGFVLSNYVPEEIFMENRLKLTIWTATKRTEEVHYLLTIIPKLIAFFEDYFGLPMPTSHIDYYGVPEIMPYITSKLSIIIVPETDMLVKENETCEDQKERVAKVAAMHIAEQWVDYLVRFQSGQKDWIRNSLVQYLQYAAIDSIHPKWKIFDEFFTVILQNEMDAEIINPTEKALNIVWIPFSRLSHQRHSLFPLNETAVFKDSNYHSQILYSLDGQKEVNPTIYSELFEEPNINMGVCLFRMLEQTLTESVLRNSVKKFLDEGLDFIRRYKTDSLWSIMTEEASKMDLPGYQLLPSHMTLDGIVNEWLFLRDFPILKVERKYDTGEVSFIQFLDSEEYASARRIRSYRHLPISFTMESEKVFTNTMPKLWLKSSKQTTISNPTGLTNDTWFLINLQQSGLFRVNYDEENWRMLTLSLEKGLFPASVRAQLVDDALFLGRRGYMNYEYALNMTRSLPAYGEMEFIVWSPVLRHFSYVEIIINSLDDNSRVKPHSMFKEYVKDLIAPIYGAIFADDALPHDPQDHSFLLLRSLIFDWACKIGIESCQLSAKIKFNTWRKSETAEEENPISPHMRYAILCNAMRYGDAEDFEFLYDRYLNSSWTDTNRPIYLRSLYCSNQINSTLPSILSDTLLKDRSLAHLHDIKDRWQVLVENPIVSTIPLDYLLTYWRSILRKFSNFVPILKNIVEGATANISKEDQLNALFRLRQDIENKPQLQDMFEDVIKHIKYKINWKYQELNVFISWLEKMATKGKERKQKA